MSPVRFLFHDPLYLLRVQDLILWRISEAIKEGALALSLKENDLDDLPKELMDTPWLQILNLSRNRFINCESCEPFMYLERVALPPRIRM